MRFFTRKNPTYMSLLLGFQFTAAIYFFNLPEPKLFVGSFMVWCFGVNCGYLLAGNPPDQP